jgi:hypothetical protein
MLGVVVHAWATQGVQAETEFLGKTLSQKKKKSKKKLQVAINKRNLES